MVVSTCGRRGSGRRIMGCGAGARLRVVGSGFGTAIVPAALIQILENAMLKSKPSADAMSTFRTLFIDALFARHITKAVLVISIAPWKVLFPPINPLACTNTDPCAPLTLSNASSLRPLHISGSAFRLSKLSLLTATA